VLRVAISIIGLSGADHSNNLRRDRSAVHTGDNPSVRAAYGASRPLPRVAATVCFLITERALSLVGRNWSSCPFPDLRADSFERLSRVESGDLRPTRIHATLRAAVTRVLRRLAVPSDRRNGSGGRNLKCCSKSLKA
jgi:hypothetical protein